MRISISRQLTQFGTVFYCLEMGTDISPNTMEPSKKNLVSAQCLVQA